jgi:hypothetical protein
LIHPDAGIAAYHISGDKREGEKRKKAVTALDQALTAAMHSISKLTSLGSLAASTRERAGL